MAQVEKTVLARHRIYERVGIVAYILSLLRHSWDESAQFWETDKKAIVLQLSSLGVGSVIWATVRGWKYALNEVLFGAGITLAPSLAAATLLYLWGVIKAPYALHQDDLATTKERERDEEREGFESRIKKLEERRPRIRIGYVPPSVIRQPPESPILGIISDAYIVVKNTGEIEARRVYIKPIRFGFDGRRIVFDPVDVLDRDSSKPVDAAFYMRKKLRRVSLERFLVETRFAKTDSIELGGAELPATEMKLLLDEAIDKGDDTIEMRATYRDNYGHRYSARYRLRFGIQGKQVASAKVDVISDGEPTPIGRRNRLTYSST